jgi:ATP-dependent metalloprotease
MRDVQARALLDASYARVHALLIKHRKDLDMIAAALLEKETLTGAELRKLIGLPEPETKKL